MQQRGSTRLLLVESQLRGHRSGDKRRLDRVHEHVLRITVPVLEHAEQLHELRMNPVDPDLDDRALPGFTNRLLDLLLCLADHLLDTARMNAAIRNEPFESDSSDFPANRIV